MNTETAEESRWEDYGNWERRGALCGDSIYKRLEAIRLAVLERCKICKEFAGALESEFPGLYSITRAMQLIGSKLKRILPLFVAVDDGKIRRISLLLSDGYKKTWEQIPLDKPFSEEFERGKIALENGVLSLEIISEGDLVSPEGIRVLLWAECYSALELSERYQVFLPHSANLTLTGDWMFRIHQLLKNLIMPKQELDIRFQLVESEGEARYLWFDSCPQQKEWYLNGIYGTGVLSETDAWNRTENSGINNGYAEVRRLKTAHTGLDGSSLFGWGVPYDELEIYVSQWERKVLNKSSRSIAARTEYALPVEMTYECRYDAVEDIPFLSGSGSEGEWHLLGEQYLEQNDTILFASESIAQPSAGNGARTDRYRKCTLAIQCPFDHCGLEFL